MDNQASKIELADKVVSRMMDHDLFSQWMQLKVLEVKEGYSKVQMVVREEMVNGFGIVHGGLPFSLADSAFAFACNNRNNLSVALDVTITFTKAVHVGDILTAEAKEVHNGRSTGVYLITITNQKDEQVVLFKGTCFRTGKNLI
ncbi:MAG: hydroxyphenylacetyl-CoA thioesterase PaaI [Flavisolibacter sp.]|jgi:acyl-CoA thioesterase